MEIEALSEYGKHLEDLELTRLKELNRIANYGSKVQNDSFLVNAIQQDM